MARSTNSLGRARHDPVTQVEQSITDETGAISGPFIVGDILLRWEMCGLITREERHAGEDFRADFRRAHLDELRAMDWARPMVSGGRAPQHGVRVELARNRVAKTLDMLGGQSSLAGSCLWHVLGLEDRIEPWRREYKVAHRGGNVTRYRVEQTLIRALQVMAAAKEGRAVKVQIRSFRNGGGAE